MNNKFRIRNLPVSISIQEPISKNYVDNKYNDPSINKNTAHVDFNDKTLKNGRSIKVNSFPTLEEQLTPKIYVDQAISDGVAESSLLRLDPDEKLKLDKRGYILLNSTLTSPKTILEIPTKYYDEYKFDDPSIIKNITLVDFNDKNFNNVRFVKVNSMPAFREHLTPKFYVDQLFFIKRMKHHC